MLLPRLRRPRRFDYRPLTGGERKEYVPCDHIRAWRAHNAEPLRRISPKGRKTGLAWGGAIMATILILLLIL
jgi:hypothetical protein